jgi:cytochrome c biogenesis protein CcdA/thiol-disulfide isomerase/thioredoxin
MLVLVVFAFVAGAGTAVSPCVLPVLPALLSASATGGRRRPFGIVCGLAITFTITIVGVAKVVDGVGLGTDLTRDLAIAALLGFGLAIAVPAIGDRLEAPLSRLARLGPRSRGDGFASGLGVGAALGFVYAPCAGPILAAVIAVSAASGRTVAVGAAYALGSAVVLLALALGGRTTLDRVRRGGRGPVIQRTLGAVMAVTAVAMAFQLDVRFQTAIADHLPSLLVNPTHALEDSAAAQSRLADLRGRARFAPRPHQTVRAGVPSELPRLGAAPEFTGTQRWFNTPGGRPLTLAALRARHRVVLIDFWTYTCINCIRTLPYLKAWDARYRDKGLTIVGVHSPEFSFEKDAGNVQAAIRQNGLRYPVVQDNDLATWGAWGNQYWPAEYLIDARGQVRRAHFGEGEYDKSESAIRALLKERGDTALGASARARGAITPSAQTSPETYLGAARAQGFLPAAPTPGTHTYGRYAPKLPLSRFTLSGTWRITDESATAVHGARLDANVQGKRVYLVLSSAGGAPRSVQVALDGRPYRTVTVRGQRLYELVSLPRVQRHHLALRLDDGIAGFAFTFG